MPGVDFFVLPRRMKKIESTPENRSGTTREAKAIVALALRNGPIENVHAGKACPTVTVCRDDLHFRPRRPVVGLKVEDYFPQKKHWWWLRLREKNAKVNEMPCHHKLEQYLDAYIKVLGIHEDPRGRCSVPPWAVRRAPQRSNMMCNAFRESAQYRASR